MNGLLTLIDVTDNETLLTSYLLYFYLSLLQLLYYYLLLGIIISLLYCI